MSESQAKIPVVFSAEGDGGGAGYEDSMPPLCAVAVAERNNSSGECIEEDNVGFMTWQYCVRGFGEWVCNSCGSSRGGSSDETQGVVAAVREAMRLHSQGDQASRWSVLIV